MLNNTFKEKLSIEFIEVFSGDPYGIRTRVAAVKGRCPKPLDEGANIFNS